jgi:hypothetical protein
LIIVNFNQRPTLHGVVLQNFFILISIARAGDPDSSPPSDSIPIGPKPALRCCASNTTSAPGMRRARPRSTQPSMCLRRRPSSMVRSARSRSAPPTWLLGALRAGGPYPVLAIAGEQGSAKTVLSKLLRAVIDPSVAPVRALPRDERELFIAARHSHVLAFDNLSGLPPWLSDTLCRLTSGGAFSTRRLFTDQDEMLFAAARPIIVNGIEDIITRPDVADRAILLMLAPIAEGQRRPEHALWREFELARPYILGALLDAAAYGLQMLPRVRLKRLPRMADFALWATACESAFRSAGTFDAAYSTNRRDARSSFAQHPLARDWLDQQLNGSGPVGLPWVSLPAFLRLVTNPRAFEHPEPIGDAWRQVEAWPRVFFPRLSARPVLVSRRQGRRIDVGWVPPPAQSPQRQH